MNGVSGMGKIGTEKENPGLDSHPGEWQKIRFREVNHRRCNLETSVGKERANTTGRANTARLSGSRVRNTIEELTKTA